MARRRNADDDVLGNRNLANFEFCIIGSGAGGGTAAHVLTAAGHSVLVLEAGHNPFPGLDDPDVLPLPLHSSDELKYSTRDYLQQQSLLEPRVFRRDEREAGALEGDVNLLPKAVGGAFQHADGSVPRFNEVDFRLKSSMEALLAATPGLAVPGFGADAASANFADWPFSYADLEPFYVEAEHLYGVQGLAGDNLFESARSRPYPMPPGVPMYFALLLAEGARRTPPFHGEPLHPHVYPKSINSQFRDGRPPCVDCGYCSGFGCPNHSKGSPAVTALRRALLSGRCQLRANAQAVRLLHDGGRVSAVEYVDGTGSRQTATASAFLLAASPIESARLCLLSDPGGPGLGNASGELGRNLMFHFQTNVNGFFPQRLHAQRGRAVTHGLSDFRGVLPGGTAIRVFVDGTGPHVYMGGICEFGAPQGLPIEEDGVVYALDLPGALGAAPGMQLKNAMRDLPLGQHLCGFIMQGEDAPQRTNRIDLDPRFTDVFGSPVARITYRNHPYETSARTFYIPILKDVLRHAGATNVFVAPCLPAILGPPSTRHVLGTLRMGPDSASSVTNPAGRFHEVENLYACDGSVFPTGSGYNPTLTIIAVALKIAHGIAGTAPDVPAVL
jgi:gluconate 2-dehydrogenase alpha chain